MGSILIPANLKLYSAEYELAARVARTQPNLLNRLAEGIASIADHFDVVILDPPPALGTISLIGYAGGQRAAGARAADGGRLHLDHHVPSDVARDDADTEREGVAG